MITYGDNLGLGNIAQSEVWNAFHALSMSKTFKSRPVLLRLLNYVIGEVLAGNAKQITQYNIAVYGLGKAIDFDPEINTLVRVQAGRLRSALKEYYQSEGKYDPLEIVLPSRKYEPSFRKKSIYLTQTIDINRKISSVSTGPCIAPSFICEHTNHATQQWVQQIETEFVSILGRFAFAKVIVPHQTKKNLPIPELIALGADFTLLFQINYLNKVLTLNCVLTHVITREVVWSNCFSLSEQINRVLLDTIYRKICNDTIGEDHGLAHSYWCRYLQENHTVVPHCQRALVHLRNIILYADRNRVTEALDFCRKRVKNQPYDLVANLALACICMHLYIGRTYFNHRVQNDWINACHQALRLNPSSAEAHGYFAALNFVIGEYDVCADEVNSALRLNNYDNCQSAHAALLFTALGQWNKSFKLMQQVMNVSDHHPSGYYVVYFFYYLQYDRLDLAAKIAMKMRYSYFIDLAKALNINLNEKRAWDWTSLTECNDYAKKQLQQLLLHFMDERNKVEASS